MKPMKAHAITMVRSQMIDFFMLLSSCVSLFWFENYELSLLVILFRQKNIENV